MTAVHEMRNTLDRMVALLRLGEPSTFPRSLEQAVSRLESDLPYSVHRILSLYGGMGSLNDVVLYRGNQLLVEENNEFDVLRSKLYDLCLKVRAETEG